ncbi:MAG: DUF1611 domain-containing protein, partial [Pseudomonadota bacterium]
DAFVVCHEPTRTHMRGVTTPLPTITQVVEMTVSLGSLTNPAIRPAGIAINTAALGKADARAAIAEAERAHGLPATDPVRFGVDPIVAHLKTEFGA